MDLLGSIMSSMDKPPSSVSAEEKQKIKERQQQLEKMKALENKKIQDFKKKIKQKIEEFLKQVEQKKMVLEPMDTVCRSLVREMADDAGLTSFSFGEDEVDRHVVIWRPEHAPTDDELAVMRRGEVWTEEKANEIKRKREENSQSGARPKVSSQPVPKSDYHKKYDHLISLEVGKDAAKDVTANKQYGNVRLENKQDKRTIEQTLAEHRAKKKKTQNLDDKETPSSSTS